MMVSLSDRDAHMNNVAVLRMFAILQVTFSMLWGLIVMRNDLFALEGSVGHREQELAFGS